MEGEGNRKIILNFSCLVQFFEVDESKIPPRPNLGPLQKWRDLERREYLFTIWTSISFYLV